MTTVPSAPHRQPPLCRPLRPKAVARTGLYAILAVNAAVVAVLFVQAEFRLQHAHRPRPPHTGLYGALLAGVPADPGGPAALVRPADRHGPADVLAPLDRVRRAVDAARPRRPHHHLRVRPIVRHGP
ncbi:hypothetical protein LV779_10500 [Streptomyces thinghirensis]|nr:hypothetical protein [Streptomyces thinghirensis]